MKTQIICLCVLGVIALVSCAQHVPFSKLQEITPEQITLVESQMPCVLQTPGASCSKIGLRAKDVLPEFLKTKKCSTCTPEEKEKIDQIFTILHTTELKKYLIPLQNLYGNNQTYDHNSN
ncbi:GSCOCT00003769001.3-RA-CDS [Cotesia congregata]|uniref:Chemosensory protein 15.3769 n=1 Tax=Cotesia congregata TaxID=51543 RepID=A0A8J2MYB2_COTCN|nr:GSCOCT00003769001.3-RA-CDS [Cotesia congregata]CAG5107314.1 Chemosensory protein 15.3769 [Cotesia congregata]